MFKIRVQPRASKNEIAGRQGEFLKIRLIAPPVDGEANYSCINFLANLLSLSKSSVEIVSGHAVRNKMIRIRGISTGQLLEALAPYL